MVALCGVGWHYCPVRIADVSMFAKWCADRDYWNAACVFNVVFGVVLPLARLVVLFSRRDDANESQPLMES